jgi:methyl-accepting chemotaxis protein
MTASSFSRFLLRNSIYLILLLGILLAVAGAVLLLSGQSIAGIWLLAVGFGGVLAWSLCWIYLSRVVLQPLRQLTSASETIAIKDSLILSDALAALAQGNLTSRISLEAKEFNIHGGYEIEQLVQVFGEVIGHIIDSGRDFNYVTDELCQRLFYVGADSFLEGRTCGEEMGKQLGGKGTVAILTGLFAAPGLEKRRMGFLHALHERYPEVRVVESSETHELPDTGYTIMQAYMNKYPQLNGLYMTEAASLPGVMKALMEKRAPGEIKLVTHDLMDETMEGMQKGYVTVTLSQDPFAQGYEPAIHLFNYLVTGIRPPDSRMLTHMSVVHRGNYHEYWQSGRGLVQSKDALARLTRPVKTSPRPLRIAVISGGVAEGIFWQKQVLPGALVAKETLSAFNATVDWIVMPDRETDTCINTFTELLTRGYSAIASPVSNNALVPYINKAMEAGVPIATYNGEPTSFRGLISMLMQRSQQINALSEKLAALSQNAGQATTMMAHTIHQVAASLTNEASAVTQANAGMQHIAAAVQEITVGAKDQARAAENVSEAASEISKAIQTATDGTRTVAEATVQAADVARHGTETVQETLRQMQIIEAAVSSSTDTIRRMHTYSQQIGDIVVTIEDIAAQTNLLALNANIEAARAGEYGRGFAVVAHEVRKLAEKSAAATKEIASIIHTVQSSVSSAAAGMETVTQNVRQGTDLAQRSGESLDQLLASASITQTQTERLVQANDAVTKSMDILTSSIDRVSAVIEENFASSQEVSTNIVEVLRLVENMTTISETNAASAEELAASTTQVTQQVAGVDEAAGALLSIARELQGATAIFKISETSS